MALAGERIGSEPLQTGGISACPACIAAPAAERLAAQAAAAHDFIMGLPNGYEFNVLRVGVNYRFNLGGPTVARY